MTDRLRSLWRDHVELIKGVLTALIALLTVVACVLPMGELPLWNGEKPAHRNQYELMAEAFLDGRLDFAYGDEDSLAGLENPYDPEERKQAGVSYHWDHAYYNGRYYMYFGVVPVFLAFLPYRLLTGEALTTYHATQLFAAAAIIGIFVLFHLLWKRFFRSLPYGVYLCLSVAVSVMSVWYSTAEPALYCTAITAAIALMIWSLYFFVRAVFAEERENRQILLAGVGALLGALAFGCRPPIALANLLVIPMLVVFLRQRKFTPKLLGKLILAALPYVFVGVSLMLYNAARFDDPFEFGQAYQLTVADQSQYRITLDWRMLVRLVSGMGEQFFDVNGMTVTFPYLRTSGVFFNFPMLFLCLGVIEGRVREGLRKNKLAGLALGLLITVLVITVFDIMWSPYLLERYRMDIYFLMGIGCFLIVGLWYESAGARARRWLTAVVSVMSVATVISAFLLCLCRINVYYPDRVAAIAAALGLG